MRRASSPRLSSSLCNDIGHGPPSHARLSRGVEHCGRKLIERLHPHERVDAEPEDVRATGVSMQRAGFGILSTGNSENTPDS